MRGQKFPEAKLDIQHSQDRAYFWQRVCLQVAATEQTPCPYYEVNSLRQENLIQQRRQEWVWVDGWVGLL